MLATPRILCIDDHRDTLELVAEFLSRSGFEPAIAASIEDARRQLEAVRFDGS